MWPTALPPERRRSHHAAGMVSVPLTVRHKFGSQPAGNTVTNTTAEPWGPQQGPLERIFGQAGTLYGQGGPQVYPGPTVAPVAPETTQAWEMQAARAAGGNPLVSGAQGYTRDVLSGNYLNANPHLDALFARSARPVTEQFTQATAPGIISRALVSGRHGSNAEAAGMRQATDILGRNLSDLSASIYAPAFAQERQHQQQAAQFAPGLANADYTDIAALGQVGAQRQAQGQAELGGNISQFQATQERPWDALQRYLSAVMGGGTYPQTKQTQPYYTNPALGALGGALGGAQLGNLAGFSPWLGALGGGLAGMF